MMAIDRVDRPVYQPRGELRHDEPMARHTSWRVGGPADCLFMPADRDDLAAFLAELPPREPLTWVGLGSNLLVRDGGIRGVVIATHRCLGRIELRAERRVYAEAGVPGAKLARFSVRHDLRGAEFFAGIPGTLGGALAMNAGAFGGETWQVVRCVETLDRRGRIRSRPVADYEIGYRKVAGPAGEWFIAAELALTPGDGAVGQRQIKELLSRRAHSQPIQIPNAGSVFRNPPGDHAARLIEASGLKGVCRGAACVSERHANFIVNRGGARAQDIEQLIGQIEEVVQDRQGVRLEREVHIIGAAP